MAERDIDFRLLGVFSSLMRTNSVSATAEQLGQSPSTVSHALQRLRDAFGDPLLVRTARGMEPTPRACELAPRIQEILALGDRFLFSPAGFDPATAARGFTVIASDAGHSVLMPRLLKVLATAAPYVHLRAVPLFSGTIQRQLEDGLADFVFGAYPALEAGIHERVLYSERYVCMLRAGHPIQDRRLTMDAFLSMHHVIVSTQTSGHAHQVAEKELLSLIPADKVRAVVPSFLLAALLVQNSDMVVTVPTAVAASMNEIGAFCIAEPPAPVHGFEVKLYWHERVHKDKSNEWMRSVIASLFPRRGLLIEASNVG